MKTKTFIKELKNNNCYFKKHGKKHDVYENFTNGKIASIPRHTEIKNTLCNVIRKQLGLK